MLNLRFSRLLPWAFSALLGGVGALGAANSASADTTEAYRPQPITVSVAGFTGATLTATYSNPRHPRAALQAILQSALDATSVSPANPPPGGGGGAEPLNCNQAYYFSDGDGTFSYQHACGGSTSPWGYRISAAIQKIIISSVHESGMCWTRNGAARGCQASHTEPKSYQFHGTFNPVHGGDYIAYSDIYTFTVEVGGDIGQATLSVRGYIFQKGPY